jgi:hypothetical protein
LGQDGGLLGWVLGALGRFGSVCHTGARTDPRGWPAFAWIVAGLEGAVVVGGISAFGAGLASIGIPHDSIVEYEVALKSDKFVLLVHGSAETVDKARHILAGTQHVGYTSHGENVYVGQGT